MGGRLRYGLIALVFGSASCAGCLRGPITDYDDGGGGFDSGADADTAATDGDSMEDGAEVGGDGEADGGTSPDPVDGCHPSYEPCLPIVDDLNCVDVVAMGAAPVTVIGPDEYELDRDNDGIGCEP